MAWSDHCRWVSRPRWARLSSKVASTLQRFMKSRTIASAGCVWSVENRALGGRFPAGSRVSTGANRQGCGAKALPPGGAATRVQHRLPFTIPVEGEALPDRLRVMQCLCERGKPRTDDARAPACVWIAHGSRLVDHRVQAKGSNQGDLLAGTVQAELQDAVGLVSQQLDRHSRQPAPQ